MSNLSGNQFELSIPPIHPPRPVTHSHSPTSPVENETPEQRGIRVMRETSESHAHPFVKVGPVVEPEKTVEKPLPGGGSWTHRVPATHTVTPPLFVMPHELAHHSHLGDLGVDDAHLDSQGMPAFDYVDDTDTNKDLMQRKLYAPHPKSADVAESVRKHGIQVPVDVDVNPKGELTLRDGHHRLAAALHHRPNDPVPIDWENIGHS